MTAEQATYGLDPDRFYRPRDDEMRKFASVDQLAQWRHQGIGLPWHKIGQKIYYSGADLIRYLNEVRVEPQAKPKRRKRKDDAAEGVPATA